MRIRGGGVDFVLLVLPFIWGSLSASFSTTCCVGSLNLDTGIEPLISPLESASNSDNRFFSSRMTRLSGSKPQVRVNGVQMHPTSLPGGRLGDAAFAFVDWLAEAGQSYWQLLPLGPTG